jgi:hypothetical protein
VTGAGCLRSFDVKSLGEIHRPARPKNAGVTDNQARIRQPESARLPAAMDFDSLRQDAYLIHDSR